MNIMREVIMKNMFQRAVPIASLSKIYAARSMILTVSMSCSTMLFGFVADQFGVRLVYLIGGTLLATSALCSFGLNQGRQQSSFDASTGISG